MAIIGEFLCFQVLDSQFSKLKDVIEAAKKSKNYNKKELIKDITDLTEVQAHFMMHSFKMLQKLLLLYHNYTP